MARGILAWMINGCLEWQRIGLAPPPAVQAATAEYLDAEDTVQLWIDECCEVGRQHWTVFSDLYESWSKWAEVNGEYVLPARRFAERLDAFGYLSEKRDSGLRGKQRGRCGLTFKYAEPMPRKDIK